MYAIQRRVFYNTLQHISDVQVVKLEDAYCISGSVTCPRASDVISLMASPTARIFLRICPSSM